MNKIDEKLFRILRLIQKKPNTTQRKLAKDLDLSLGKLNYCINELKNKGLVKFEKFKNKSNKIENIGYILTPSGISERTKLTINFMKNKMKEYDELKKELNQKIDN
jgi:EPS-associated MarR family transcriptional regulator